MNVDESPDPPSPRRGEVRPAIGAAGSIYCWGPMAWKYAPPADVLSAGYGNRSVAHLVALTEKYECRVADIRLDPRSVRPEWSKENLSSIFGSRYAHIDALGNLNHALNGAEIDINDLDRGVALIKLAVSAGKVPLLLCACGAPERCHRSIVCAALRAAGLTVCEIYDWPAPARIASPAEEN